MFDLMDEGESSSAENRDRVRIFVEEYLKTPVRTVKGDWRVQVGGSILLLYALAGTLGVVLIDPPSQHVNQLLVPPFTNPAFPLGTDGLGQGMLALLVHATPAMLEMILVGALFTTIVGSIIGITAGYKGGNVDRVLTTLTDVMMTIPGLPLVLILALFFQPEAPWMVGLILAIDDWPALTRSLRSQVLSMRNAEYIEASRTMGLDYYTIFTRDILRNLLPYISVRFVGSSRKIIYSSIGLYFLGILPFSNLNWGVMLNFAYQRGALYTLDSVHWLLLPMLTIVLLSWGLILFAQGMDRMFNPRLRAKHSDVTPEEETDEAPESKLNTYGDL